MEARNNMSDTATPAETATAQPLDNNVSAPVTTPVVNTGQDAAEANKRAEQAQMEANMLRNKLKAFEDAQATAQAKDLEDREEYKALYEQEKKRAEELAFERTETERKQVLAGEEAKLLADYPEAVKEIVKETGVSLTDATDEAKAELKSKLDRIAERVGGKLPVTPNNTRTVNNPESREELLAQFRKTGDPALLNKAVNELSFVKPFIQQ